MALNPRNSRIQFPKEIRAISKVRATFLGGISSQLLVPTQAHGKSARNTGLETRAAKAGLSSHRTMVVIGTSALIRAVRVGLNSRTMAVTGMSGQLPFEQIVQDSKPGQGIQF